MSSAWSPPDRVPRSREDRRSGTGVVWWAWSQPLAFHSCKRIGTSFQPEFGFGGDAVREGIVFGAILPPFFRGEADGVDFPAQRISQATERGAEFPQSHVADHEQVHIAFRRGRAGGDGAEDQCEVDALDRSEGAGEFGGNAGGLERDAVEFRVERVGGIGAVVEPVAIAAGEHEFLGGEGGEFLLERCGTERGKPGKVAQVDFLISGLEEQAENFRPGLGKEIGERAHCSRLMNDCLPEVNKILRAFRF